MRKEFQFLVQDENRKRRYFTQCRAMHIMAALLLIVYTLPYIIDFKENWVYILAILIPSLLILFLSLFKKELITEVNNNRVFRVIEAGFLMMGCMHYLQTGQNIPALLFGLASLFMLFLLWMESRIFRDQYIIFNEDKVEVDLPIGRKRYDWGQLHAVMLQQDFITLSFKDNTIQQLNVRQWYSELEAGDFLFFCKDCIRK